MNTPYVHEQAQHLCRVGATGTSYLTLILDINEVVDDGVRIAEYAVSSFVSVNPLLDRLNRLLPYIHSAFNDEKLGGIRQRLPPSRKKPFDSLVQAGKILGELPLTLAKARDEWLMRKNGDGIPRSEALTELRQAYARLERLRTGVSLEGKRKREVFTVFWFRFAARSADRRGFRHLQ
jgi:hypothetical protein